MDVSIRICGGCRLPLCVLLGLGLHSEKGCGFLSSHGCFPCQICGQCLSPLLHTLLGCWALAHSRLPGSGSSISLYKSPHGETCRSLEESTLLQSWSGSMDLLKLCRSALRWNRWSSWLRKLCRVQQFFRLQHLEWLTLYLWDSSGRGVLKIWSRGPCSILFNFYLSFYCQLQDVLHQLKSNSPFSILWACLETWGERGHVFSSQNFDEFDGSFNTSLPNLLTVIFHQVLDQWLNVLVGLVFVNRM